MITFAKQSPYIRKYNLENINVKQREQRKHCGHTTITSNRASWTETLFFNQFNI